MMMQVLRKILLFPFALLYGALMRLRRVLYQQGIFTRTKSAVCTVVVGNLRVGGTGKTPHVEYIIQKLRNHYEVAVLSRGYGRKTKGFRWVQAKDNALQVGDEPLQYKNKFIDVPVAVDEQRVRGVAQIAQQNPKTDVIVLDDAYQHLALQADLYLLLTEYHRPFYNDLPLPAGNLREFAAEKSRADAIIVTKCPQNLTKKDKQNIIQKINPQKDQVVFFSVFRYGNLIPLNNLPVLGFKDLKNYEQILLLTGIENPEPLLLELSKSNAHITHLNFADHHNFSATELDRIAHTFQNMSGKKIAITTEKDAMRLRDFAAQKDLPLYYQSLHVDFLEPIAVGFDAWFLQKLEKISPL
jgi:tetraacyldisaccharide 4'-kinase